MTHWTLQPNTFYATILSAGVVFIVTLYGLASLIGTGREQSVFCLRGNLFSNSGVWPRGVSASIVCLMPEPVITVILVIYQKYIKERRWGL